MAHTNETFLRAASPNERRTISREAAGFYNAVVVAAIYEGNTSLSSSEVLCSALRHCVLQHAALRVTISGRHTDKPAYHRARQVDLRDHVSVLLQARQGEEQAIIEETLPEILDHHWTTELPPWRVVVQPLRSDRHLIAFSYSHALGDGKVGMIFHRTLLDSLEKHSSPQTLIDTADLGPLPDAFDTSTTLPISWSYLLGPVAALVLPSFVSDWLGIRSAATTISAGTWTGASIFNNEPKTNIKLLEIDNTTLAQILQLCRQHNAKLTSLMHIFILKALKKVLSQQWSEYISTTAIDMRRAVDMPPTAWGLYVSGHYQTHSSVDIDTSSTITEGTWAQAEAMTVKLAERSMELKDQPIGLLRYLPSITKWTRDKIGHTRDSSYEVSNLLAFDGSGTLCNVSKIFFAQPANVLGAPLVFNIISTKQGPLVCTLTWQTGALGVTFDEEQRTISEIMLSIRQDVDFFKL